jgi:hypothetical protein
MRKRPSNGCFWRKPAIRRYVASGGPEPIGGWNDAITMAMVPQINRWNPVNINIREIERGDR